MPRRRTGAPAPRLELPILTMGGAGGTGATSSTPRASRNAPKRALVLLALHAVLAAHVAHWWVTGRSVSPIEPSESMYTLELGEVNAGFVFFAAAVLATLVFGRFVCGWGCHVVALQDGCAWLLKKAGLRPRPVRSRLLAVLPLILSLYMFVWPTFARVVLRLEAPPFPGFTNHLVTSDFWRTFPGPVMAVATLVTAGVVAVYFLGSKGYCTYGCPYGVLFSAADRFAPGRIVVNDDCEGCGHCTATCTSNVLVHQEVREHGMVVYPGCMKCLDCVSVCPKGALRWSFTVPPALRRLAHAVAPPRGELGWRDELIAGVTGVAAMLSFRGLYDGPPFLMAVGLGAVTGFVSMKAWQLARGARTVRLQSHALRLDGRLTRAGAVFVALAGAWLAFTAHSGFVQWQRWQGGRWLERTEVSRADALSGSFRTSALSADHARAAARMERHFGLADRWGLVPVAEVELGLAWAALLGDRPDEAERRLRAAVALTAERPQQHENLLDFLLARGRRADAIPALRAKIDATGETASDRMRLGALLADEGRSAEAVAELQTAARLSPDLARPRLLLGAVLRRLGRAEEAARALDEAVRPAPDDVSLLVEHAGAHADAGDLDAAIDSLGRARALVPPGSAAAQRLSSLIAEMEAAR